MSRRLRVLMTSDTLGGVWTYAQDLSRALIEVGAEIFIATMGRALSKHERRHLESIEHLTVIESEHRLEWMDDPWRDVEAAAVWLEQLDRTIQPDVVHLNGYAHAQVSFSAPVLIVGHSCVCSWWQAVLGEEAPARYDRYRREVRAGLARADVVVAPTRAMLESLRELYGPLQETRVIANGIWLDEWHDGPKRRSILAAGRVWDRAKNLQMVEALAERIDRPVRIADGKIDRRTLASWMSRDGLFVHPSLYEPFGLVVLEAAASGCAPLVSDLPSIREIWGDAALYFDPRSLESLAEAAMQLIEDDDELLAAGERARARSRSYDIRASARRHLSLYADLMRRRRHQPAASRMEGPR